MKYLIIFLSFIFYSVALPAQDKGNGIVTETFDVSGNCGSCKDRIEKAAYVKGVKRAEWNKESKVLTVTYKTSKTSPKDILKSVAEIGYDNEQFTAPKEVYEKLPDCCHYRTGVCDK